MRLTLKTLIQIIGICFISACAGNHSEDLDQARIRYIAIQKSKAITTKEIQGVNARKTLGVNIGIGFKDTIKPSVDPNKFYWVVDIHYDDRVLYFLVDEIKKEVIWPTENN